VTSLEEKPARSGRTGRWLSDPNALPNVRGERLRLESRLALETGKETRQWLRSLRRPWAVDLFCGAGGLGLGLHEAGFSVVAAADYDPVAIETYAANLESLTYCGDLGDPSRFLRLLSDNGIHTVDLVAGGPPCQPFSRAGASKIRSLVAEGKRDRHDPRADLWRSFTRIVRALKPNMVLLENVPDMGRWNDGAVLVAVMQSLRELGYVPDTRVLDAFRYGVPQHRARIFVVGVSRGRFDWPAGNDDHVTLRDAIGDLPVVEGGQRRDALPYEQPKTDFQKRARANVPDHEKRLIHDHCTRCVRPDDLRAYRLMKPGQTYADIPGHLRRYRVDIFDDKYKRLSWNELSRTITAHIARDGYWYIHPEQHRTLSIREAARIQTFPDWFRFAGHPTTQYRQIGNAVPPALAYAIGRELFRGLRRKTRREDTSFREALIRWHRGGNRIPLPWRSSYDPWLILISELLLRRVSIERIGSVYEALREIAPDAGSTLARSRSVREGLKSLGLDAKTDLVLAIANAVVCGHEGEMPRGDAEIRRLPGVGEYLAAVVRCLAYGIPTVVMDAGSRRIVGRFTGQSARSTWATRLELTRLAGSAGPDAEFNLALADLASSVCRAFEPICQRCPLARECAGARTRSSSRNSS
jgi:DNA (cytosine-5)-methyltransferase 1